MQTVYAFALGDQVDLARAVHNTLRGPYEITAILPENPAGEPQYALRSETGHERVVTEAEILPAAAPVEQAKPSPEEAKAKREADRKEREEQANSAWKDYLDERDHVARRTAELRELRLKAEAEAAEKIARLAREAALNKSKGKVNGAKTAMANGAKTAQPKGKAEAKPAVKGKAEVKPAPVKQAAKPKAEAKPAAKKPAAKAAATAKPAAEPAAKGKAKAPVKAAEKTARPKAASVPRAAPKAKARARG